LIRNQAHIAIFFSLAACYGLHLFSSSLSSFKFWHLEYISFTFYSLISTMSDLNWCPVCDQKIFSGNALYCSQACLRDDALRRNPLLGYDFSELQDFPRPYSNKQASSSRRSFSSTSSATSSLVSSPNVSPITFPTPHYKLSPPAFDLGRIQP
jgi:ECL1/2/3 zinc binding proteins